MARPEAPAKTAAKPGTRLAQMAAPVGLVIFYQDPLRLREEPEDQRLALEELRVQGPMGLPVAAVAVVGLTAA